MPQGTEYTKQRAEWFNIPLQKDGESDGEFRERVSGALRTQGRIIEAHEAFNNCLYDDPAGGGNVMNGIIGAIALERQGIDYGSDGIHQVGDDIAAGVVSRAPKPPSADALLLMIALLEGGRQR